jgi:hypothetical protein
LSGGRQAELSPDYWLAVYAKNILSVLSVFSVAIKKKAGPEGPVKRLRWRKLD